MLGTDAQAHLVTVGLDPESPLGARLKACRVRVRAEDPNTLILQNVPANRRFFSKAGTNLMVRRTKANLPFLVAVDEDLEYTGTDPVLARAFAGGTTQQGWRIIFLDSRIESGFAIIVEDALRAVGFEDKEPGWRPAGAPEAKPQGSMLARFGREVEAPSGDQSRDGRETVAGIAASLVALHPRLPVILGGPGVGKSHLLALLAGRLPAIVAGTTVVNIDLGHLFMGTLLESERENLLAAVLDDAAGASHVVLALERLDLVRAETRHGTAALARAVEGGARIVATVAASSLAMFDDSPLARHLHGVPVAALSVDDTCDVVRAALPCISAHHRVRAVDEHVRPLVERAATLAGHLPATALALADAACARARIDGRDELDIAHVYIAACAFREHEEQ
ncbi:MAG: hypothetical protein NT151_06680 [Acidobacteria bacterium]|nr:hypothetical protein [Acidobacteriota bacterium]